MEHVNSKTEVKAAILQLENNQAANAEILKTQFHLAYQSAKPINLLKNTLLEAAKSQSAGYLILNTSVGLAAGYLSKMLFEGVSHSPYRKIIGAVLLFGITNIVAHNPETVKTMAKGVFDLLRSKKADRN